MSSNGDEEIVGINVTPLVDVVLVLLVVLMVTAGYIASKAIPVDLPKAVTGESVPQTLALSIDASGTFYLDGRSVEAAELRAKVGAAKRARPDLRAVIAADGRVFHARVVQLIDLLRQENVTEFALDVRPEDLGKP
ncbi:MAG TPA: biopolymer transporter ExbD [Polyangiaceae bacterium]|nr:biopolymer transporter ExbD [Polyangiaceae bacterium]